MVFEADIHQNTKNKILHTARALRKRFMQVSKGFLLTGASGAIEIESGIKKAGSGFGELFRFERILALK